MNSYLLRVLQTYLESQQDPGGFSDAVGPSPYLTNDRAVKINFTKLAPPLNENDLQRNERVFSSSSECIKSEPSKPLQI